MILSRRKHALFVGTALTAALTATALAAPNAQADPPVNPAVAASFTRINIDPGISGAAFTVSGAVFGTEKNLVTSGFGPFAGCARGAGTVQVYRPGGNVGVWSKVRCSTSPRTSPPPTSRPSPTSTVTATTTSSCPAATSSTATTLSRRPGTEQSRGSLTWWENTGPSTAFLRHDIATLQPWAYHGIEFADLDGDGNKDILTVGEQGKNPSDPTDDLVRMQLYAGNGNGTFDPPASSRRRAAACLSSSTSTGTDGWTSCRPSTSGSRAAPPR